ncbi:hypothetical protein [Methylotuvimicrobium sp. KM2]|uniref:hypothetical protein n=1 Tax=Methylotuvimicrobium sp. KM2 TaxID=3133976 RepID=UPI0031014F75
MNPVNVDGIGKVTEISALVVSCAYCCEAQRAFDDGRINDAWTYIIDAKDWLRVPLSRHAGITELINEEHKSDISRIRRESRKKGIEKYDYSDFILKEYRKKAWKNKAQAVEAINKLLGKYIENNNLPVRVLQVELENGNIAEERQTDFTKYVYGILPSAQQVKIDAKNFRKKT